MKRLIAFSTALALMAATASTVLAEPSDMMGLGNASCAEFAQDFRRSPVAAENAYTNWLFGFLTGANAVLVAGHKPTHNIGALSLRDLKMRMRDYCDAHPLANYIDGGAELFAALPMMPKADQVTK